MNKEAIRDIYFKVQRKIDDGFYHKNISLLTKFLRKLEMGNLTTAEQLSSYLQNNRDYIYNERYTNYYYNRLYFLEFLDLLVKECGGSRKRIVANESYFEEFLKNEKCDFKNFKGQAIEYRFCINNKSNSSNDIVSENVGIVVLDDKLYDYFLERGYSMDDIEFKELIQHLFYETQYERKIVEDINDWFGFRIERGKVICPSNGECFDDFFVFDKNITQEIISNFLEYFYAPEYAMHTAINFIKYQNKINCEIKSKDMIPCKSNLVLDALIHTIQSDFINNTIFDGIKLNLNQSEIDKIKKFFENKQSLLIEIGKELKTFNTGVKDYGDNESVDLSIDTIPLFKISEMLVFDILATSWSDVPVIMFDNYDNRYRTQSYTYGNRENIKRFTIEKYLCVLNSGSEKMNLVRSKNNRRYNQLCFLSKKYVKYRNKTPHKDVVSYFKFVEESFMCSFLIYSLLIVVLYPNSSE